MYLQSYEILQECSLFYISNTYCWDWLLEFWSHLKMSCKIGRETVCYTLQGLSKTNMSCKHKNFKLKMFTIKLEILCKKFHPNWVSTCHPFDDVGRVEVCFQSSTPPIIPSPMYSFSSTLRHGWFICYWIAHTKVDITFVRLDAQI